MSKSILAASAAVFFMAAPALASVPVLSGAYIVNYNEICQANANSSDSGQSHSEELVVTFDPGTSTATLSGTDVSGGLIIFGETTPGYTVNPVSGTGPYSNTKSTVTIGGTVFNIAYGPKKNGIVQSAVFNGVTSGNCAASAMAVHQ